MNLRRGIWTGTLLFGMTFLMLGYQNCARVTPKEASTDGSKAEVASKAACTFVEVDTLRAIVRNNIGLTEVDPANNNAQIGDVILLQQNDTTRTRVAQGKSANQTWPQYWSQIESNVGGRPELFLSKFQSALGKGDAANDLASDMTCTAMKFKLSLMVLIDACKKSHEADPAGFNQRFFEGKSPINNYDKIYMTFIGRLPDENEISVLNDMVKQISRPESVAPAVCGAIAASMESLSRS